MVAMGAKSCCDGGCSPLESTVAVHPLGETTLEQFPQPVDVTVKTIYGRQQGAEIGHNPHKPGRLSHAYHSYFMANTRPAMEKFNCITPAAVVSPAASRTIHSVPVAHEQGFLVSGDDATLFVPSQSDAEYIAIPRLLVV
jgi:hypothetical protein